MAFWDFFRKKAKKIEEVSSEKVKLGELESWLMRKKSEIEKQEESLLKLICERINQIIQEFESEILILKKINVEEKKAEEKIKLIVKENLENYIHYLERLAERLKEIKAENQIIEKINSIFSDFEKKSKMSFEKATFLIGKEMASVKESIISFFRDLEKILKDNRELIDKSKIISLVEMKINKSNEIKKIKLEIEKIIKEHDNEMSSLKERIESKEREIGEIKSSEKFIEQEKKKNILARKKEELKKEISELREIIDFKALAGFFHSFQKEMIIIKAYKENFREQFSKTNGQELLNLLRESKMQDVKILNKIQKIEDLKKELDEEKIENFGIGEIESEIKQINSEIAIVNSKKLVEEKRREKLEKSLSEISNSLKEELLKINVEVV